MSLSSATGYSDLKRLDEMQMYDTWGRKTMASGANLLTTPWRLAPNSGTTQGNVVCASTTVGSWWMSTTWPAPAAANLWLTAIESHVSTAAIVTVATLLIDRLVHTDGQVLNVATTQTVNTTTLTRSTDGIGNMIGLQLWTTGAMTSIAVTVKYTNTSGTTGIAAPAVQITGTIANRFFPIPLAAGSLGVKAVEEIQFASSGTAAGNIGAVIYRPLAVFPGDATHSWGLPEPYRNMFIGGGFAMSSVMSSACLDALSISQNVASYDLQYRISFIEKA